MILLVFKSKIMLWTIIESPGISVYFCNGLYTNRKRLDGTLQDLEDKQNSKKETVCNSLS